MLKFPQTKLSVKNTLSRISHPPFCSVYLYPSSHQPTFNFALSLIPCQYIVVNQKPRRRQPQMYTQLKKYAIYLHF